MPRAFSKADNIDSIQLVALRAGLWPYGTADVAVGTGTASREFEDVMDTVDIRHKGTMQLSDRILQLSWKPGITVEFDDARDVLSALATLGQGAALPLLIDLHEVKHSAAAR